MNNKQFNEISKFLSYILRHEPHAIGLELDTEGWADINSLITGAAKEGRLLDQTAIHKVVTVTRNALLSPTMANAFEPHRDIQHQT
jgi:RNA:NAD 2'-phosphotransferase (TPT1/KptA family)